MCSGSFKNVIYKLCVYKSYVFDMYKQDLALNNLERLGFVICLHTKDFLFHCLKDELAIFG